MVLVPEEGGGMVACLQSATPLWKWHFYYITHCIKYHSNHFKNAILLVILISNRVAPRGSSRVSNEAKKLNGTWIFGFEPLLFSHSWINFEKPSQKLHFLTYFWMFWKIIQFWLKSSGWNQKKMSSLMIFASFDTPLDPRSATLMDWNDLRGI